jgi:hypothetical protein
MTTWFCIPSANRPVAFATLPIWREQGYRVAVQLDPDQPPYPSSVCDLQFHRPYRGWAEAVNFLMREILDSEPDCTLLVTGGDDVTPDLRHTAPQIEEIFYERFPDGYGVMQPAAPIPTAGKQDRGRGHKFAWSPFVGPRFAALSYRGKGPLHPGYFHCFADTELLEVAKMQGCWFPNDALTHDHLYFRWANLAPPHYRRNIRRARADDKQLYWSRHAEGFPGSHRLDGPDLSGTGW